MSILAANVAYANHIFDQRLGQDYWYGGSWSPNVSDMTDCSGLVGCILEALTQGPAMQWGHPVSTESWPYDYNSGSPAPPGTVGPFGTVAISSPADASPDAVAIVAIHHGGGGADSHTNISVRGRVMEDNGSAGVCTMGTGAQAQTDAYWTDFWQVNGPIEGDTNTPPPPGPVFSLFADISEWQCVVDDSYPYHILSIRVCDGTYRDRHFSQNYAWMRHALDTGKLVCGILYVYVEPDWQATLDTFVDMVNANGGLHPHVILMLDIEHDQHNHGDMSAYVTPLYDALVGYADNNPARVIAYASESWISEGIWRQAPVTQNWVVAAYGHNPDLPVSGTKVAHQYSNGTGYGNGLPEGAPPFGNCDMNSADGYTAQDFAKQCGIDVPPGPPPPIPVAPIRIPLDNIDRYAQVVSEQFSG